MPDGPATPFDLQGGILLAAMRAAWVAVLFSGFGALVFRVRIAPMALARMEGETAVRLVSALRRVAGASLAAAGVLGGLWLLVQAGVLADAGTLTDAVSAAPTVLIDTRFGHVLAGQIACVALALLLLAVGDLPVLRLAATTLAGVSVCLQAWHGHAASMASATGLLLAADVVHVAAAAGWLGCLLPLLLVVRIAPPRAGTAAARAFAPLGRTCVFALAASAIFQGFALIGDLPGLIGTAYGWLALVKLALLGVLLSFAWANRYRFAPALLGEFPEQARRRLIRSIAVQTGFGLTVVLAAGVLCGLPPALHVQPIWPFALHPSLDAVREDPGFRTEAILAGAALCGAPGLLVLAWGVHAPWQYVAAVAAVALGWMALPHLGLLFAGANPTFYFTSPTRFSAASIARGALLYPRHCASCHGEDGRGDGLAGHGLAVPPADLTAPHLWAHSDGELFWWLWHGIDAPDGKGLAMPRFAEALSDDDRWALIDAIRAGNAGLARAATGDWPQPVRAPEFQSICPGGHRVDLADLRGRPIRLVIGVAPPSAESIVTTIVMGGGPWQGECRTDDPAVADAYARVSGLPPSGGAGAQFLIDAAGWLRAVQPPGTAQGWDDPVVLATELARIALHPMAAPAPDHRGMAM